MKLTVAILLIIISSFCSSHYIKGQCVEIFSYTANSQTWVVPLGVTNIQIECWGAQGGDSESCISGGPNPQVDGGLGGYSKGLYTVTPGDVLYIYVGGKPASGDLGSNNDAGGFNGGGNGGEYSGAGGGASDVRVGGTDYSDRIIVAGGGGGGNTGCPNQGTGGPGGGLTGGNGIQLGGYSPGLGGTQTAGGAPGGGGGLSGNLGTGGHYGISGNLIAGGGGGYYGGGSAFASGGGGGSSYLGGMTSGTTTSGVRTGNGEVVIKYTTPFSCIGNQTRDLALNETTYTVVGTEFDPLVSGVLCATNDFNNSSSLDGAKLPEGVTTIKWSLTDLSGSTIMCQFNVTVNFYTSLKNIKESEIIVHPNPTKGIVYIESKNEVIELINVIDLNGKTVIKKFEKQEEKVTIDCSSLNPGLYIITIQTNRDAYKSQIVKK